VLGTIISVRVAQPTIFTVPDGLFRSIEKDGYFPLLQANGAPLSWGKPQIKWIDPADPRMPDIDLTIGPANRWQIVLILAFDRHVDSKELLPPAKSGLLAVYDPSAYTTNWSTTVGNPRFYMFHSTRAIVRHTEGDDGDKGKRHDTAQTFCDLNGLRETQQTRVPMMFEPKELQGGDLSAVSICDAFYMPLTAARYSLKIGGKNPSKREVRAEIARQANAMGLGRRIHDLWAIAYIESQFHQFDVWNPKREGLPQKGPGTDWGIMQLNAVPYSDGAAEGYRPYHVRQQALDPPGYIPQRLWPPPKKQLWDWRANIAGGLRVYASKAQMADGHFRRLEEIAQQAGTKATLSERQRRVEIAQRDNTNLMYWTGWDNDKQTWILNPLCADPRTYGNKVMAVVDGLEAKPPQLPQFWDD
jgi:hypothetical protein